MTYEGFTDTANRTMLYANSDAGGRGHEEICTEHILHGLLRNTTGVYLEVLGEFGIDPRELKRGLEELTPPDINALIMGRLPLSPRSRKIIEYSRDEAERMTHEYVGTEHLLLGCVREADGLASTVLQNYGFTLDPGRKVVARVMASKQQ